MMMMMQTVLMSAIFLSALATLSLCDEDQEFEVINTGRFGTDENTIELECRSRNGLPVPRARFWLNEVSRTNELRALGFTITERQNGNQIIFQITQALEGTYFCGSDLENYGEIGQQIIAFPSPFQMPIPIEERTFFAKAGTRARLNCSILPGALRERYFVDWIDANTSSKVAGIDGPRPSNIFTAPSPRFFVDEETFSLMIDSVALSDAGSYRCVLGVRDPGGREMLFKQTETVDLTLIVYQAPIIIEEPEDEIIALSDSDPNQSVTFHCETRGDPQPEIVWLLGSKEIDNDDAKYVVRTQARRSGPGDYFVSSRLTIWNVDAHDAGDVVCRAIANDDNLPTALQTADSVAQLAVIGSFNRLDLLISQNHDIIFKLMLPAPILVPVQLSIVYMDANNLGRVSSPRVTSNTYSNTKMITHLEPSFQVPSDFDSVRIQIRLQFGRLRGPVNTSTTFNIQTANVLTEEQASVDRTTIISIASSVTAFGVLVAFLITVITCVCCYRAKEQNKRKHEKDKRKHKQDIEKSETKHKHDLEKQKTDNQHEINKKLVSMHAQEMSKIEGGWRIVYKVDDNEISIEKKSISCETKIPSIRRSGSSSDSSGIGDMIDGPETSSDSSGINMVCAPPTTSSGSSRSGGRGKRPIHTVYSAHAVKRNERPALRRGKSIDVESTDNSLERTIMVDCVQTIIKASMNDSVLGPTLRRYVSTESS